MTKQNWAIVILFLSALGAWRFFSADDQQVNSASAEYKPDFTAEVLRTVEYNTDGKIVRRTFADKMEHYSELGMTMFSNPVIILYDKAAKATWKIQSKEGVFNTNDDATLRDDVIITNMTPNDYVDLITTTYLQMDLNENKVRSDQLITISGKLLHQTGVGLEGDLKKESMTIFKQVKATYNNDKKI